MATFKCKDIGMKDNFEVKDDNQEELIHIIKHHLEKTHNMQTVPAEMAKKIGEAITPPMKISPEAFQHEEHVHQGV
jgi:predicted small metal-binding protein